VDFNAKINLLSLKHLLTERVPFFVPFINNKTGWYGLFNILEAHTIIIKILYSGKIWPYSLFSSRLDTGLLSTGFSITKSEGLFQKHIVQI
jgi:hypothetical protein